MRDGLAEAVQVIRRSADGVGMASRQIAEGHADLSTRTDEQAASLEETASSMEQLAATVKQNSDSARQAKELASETSKTAAKGGGEMERVIGTMGGISEASRKIATERDWPMLTFSNAVEYSAAPSATASSAFTLECADLPKSSLIFWRTSGMRA